MLNLPRGSSLADRLTHRRAIDGNGCWLWLGHIGPEGYGTIAVDGKTRNTHRVAYETFVGPVPDGLVLDHLCRVRSCFNPEHLEAVTQRTNTLRSPVAPAALFAARTHCGYGHEYTPENTYTYERTSPAHGVARRCRACQREKVRAYKARARAAALIEAAKENTEARGLVSA